MIIAVDFDGTIVEHRFPDIGNEATGAIDCLLDWQKQGHLLILYTMRSGIYLEQAVKYCEERGLHFWSVNSNPEQKSWTDSPKVYAHIYIDDASLGCPLKPARMSGTRDVVDWDKVAELIKDKGIK